MLNNPILFESERLAFRNWNHHDIDDFAELNADPKVMKYFPKTLDGIESAEYLEKLQLRYQEFGYTYFATIRKKSNELIGFIGLLPQTYDAPFTPAVDIGWRLKPSAWKKGYATEGAKRCLQYGFDHLNLDQIVSTCPKLNENSWKVMERIGMTKQGEFLHPRLNDHVELQPSYWYAISNPNVQNHASSD